MYHVLIACKHQHVAGAFDRFSGVAKATRSNHYRLQALAVNALILMGDWCVSASTETGRQERRHTLEKFGLRWLRALALPDLPNRASLSLR